MEDLKAGLGHVHRHLGELEASARKLPNQNFADIIKSARAKLAQAQEHADLDKVHEQFKTDLHEAEQAKFPFDPAAGA